MSEPDLLRSSPRWRRLAVVVLSVLPFLWLVVGVFFADRPSPFVLGLPLLVFWAAFGAVIAGACLSTVYFLDPHNHGRPGDQAPSDASPAFESGDPRVAGSS